MKTCAIAAIDDIVLRAMIETKEAVATAARF